MTTAKVNYLAEKVFKNMKNEGKNGSCETWRIKRVKWRLNRICNFKKCSNIPGGQIWVPPFCEAGKMAARPDDHLVI